MNAAGNYMPPMFVFPRKRENPLLMNDAPPESFVAYHESGWIAKETLDFPNPEPQKPALLILDGHSSHAKSLELINLARENNVVLVCFPPHTTHRLQPLHVSFMAPLSAFYEQEVRKWLLNHPGRSVTIYQIGKLFIAAFSRAATVQTAVGEKKKKKKKNTGICPLNRDVFPDHLFPLPDATEQPLDNSYEQQETPEVRRSAAQPAELQPSKSSRTSTMVEPHPSRLISRSTAVEPLPSTPRPTTTEQSQPSSPQPCGSAFTISPKTLMLPPQETDRNKKVKNGKRRDKTVILTSSPYKAEFEAEERERNTEKCVKKPGLFKRANDLANPKAKKCKKRKVEEPAMSFEEEEEYKEEGEMYEACIFCNELFIHSKDQDTWIQCTSCQGWIH
ncbi:hypothetical protein PR048_026060 [Dryococelus australis]|uniref:DDE-1 domain-containing protein n=1 Tax=Dryococelus australis TaxID=614101 RepID=A0ABQ9GKA0_9NEOP|nr:hypothetical protein PR048_026060 [Dryococelus australis]